MSRGVSKAREASLAPYRSGPQGQLRAAVRKLLLQAMGLREQDVLLGHPPPHWFPRGFHFPESREYALVAQDGLRELGYDAAVDELEERPGQRYVWPLKAKKALEILEAGPPSVWIAGSPVFKKSIYRPYPHVLIAKEIFNHARPWYRFTRFRDVPDSAFGFSGAYRTFRDALGADPPPPRKRRASR